MSRLRLPGTDGTVRLPAVRGRGGPLGNGHPRSDRGGASSATTVGAAGCSSDVATSGSAVCNGCAAPAGSLWLGTNSGVLRAHATNAMAISTGPIGRTALTLTRDATGANFIQTKSHRK